MRVIASLLITVTIAMGVYYVYIKSVVTQPGATLTQPVSTTTVKMELLKIAQAERAYSTQNNSFASIDQLTDGGWISITTPDPAGYVYSVQASPGGFTVTGTHQNGASVNGVTYPDVAIDQDMKITGE